MEVPITITLNATANIPIGNMGYVEFNESAPYVDLSGSGIIFISDFAISFPGITSKVVKLDLFVETINGWQDLSISPENISYESGSLKTIRWNLNIPGIIKLNGKIY